MWLPTQQNRDKAYNLKYNIQHHILSNDDMIHTYVNRMTRGNWDDKDNCYYGDRCDNCDG